MLKLHLVLIWVLISTILGFSVWVAKNQIVSEARIPPMVSSNQIVVKSVKLISREESLPPLGVPENPNRDIGFATVFLQLENFKEENVTFLVQDIQILNASDGKQQMFKQILQTITLKPLENAEITFQLTNKTGYGGQKYVKAIINYQLDKQVHFIESNIVEVN